MYLTDEAMDEIGRDYDLDRFAAIDGRDDIERFVSLNDYVNGDCIHEHGEWVESGHQTVYGYAVGSVYECSECGQTVEVKR